MTDEVNAAELNENARIAGEADVRAARQRVPGSFDVAFLSHVENVTELLLVRHGQQEYDANGPVSQLLDPPLSALGRTQARLVGEALSLERIEAVYASPLQRALDTGHEIARHHRLEPVVIPDLQEVGIFRDIPPDRTPLEYIGREVLAGVRQRMIEEKSWDVYPHSEGGAEFRKRVINAYAGHVIGSKYDMFFRPGHTSINVIAAADGRRALRRLNDVHHLQTAEGSFDSV